MSQSKTFSVMRQETHADTSWASQNFFGFEFGFERFTERQSMQSSLLEMRQHDRRTHKLSQNICWLACWLIQLQQVLIYFEQMVTLDIETNEHSFEPWKSKVSPQRACSRACLTIVRLQGKKFIGTEHSVGLVPLAETDKTALSDLFQRYEIDLRAQTIN